MIIVNRKEEENIDRLVKRYKRKHRDVRLSKNLRKRRYFTKPSVERRKEILSAAYRLEKYNK